MPPTSPPPPGPSSPSPAPGAPAADAAPGLLGRVRQKVVPAGVETFYKVVSGAARLLPEARPARHGVEVIAELDYAGTGAAHHRLDVYSPIGPHERLPVVVYIHGGAFRSLSKDTHWVMGLAWARAGYLVFNLNYRLAPTHPYPAACEDLARAWDWVLDNAARFAGDTDQIVVTGESAGGNLCSVLALSTVVARPEPWARQIYDRGVVPRVAVPACAVLQVSDPLRWSRRRKAAGKSAPRVVQSVLSNTYAVYADRAPAGPHTRENHGLMDPLVVMEQLDAAALGDRRLPAFFLPVGTRDPLVDDHRRMAAAVRALGGTAELAVYDGMEHAFHAFVKRPASRQLWADTFAFCADQLGPAAPAPARRPSSPGPGR